VNFDETGDQREKKGEKGELRNADLVVMPQERR